MRQDSLPSKVTLRRLATDTDREKTFFWRNDESIYKWCRQNDVIHYMKHEDWFESQASDSSVSMYGVVSAEGKELVGVCGLTSIDLINRRAEFSLYIGTDFARRGYGEAALRELIKKGFLAYGLNSIWGESFDGNPATKLFYRVGFKPEGIRRSFYYRDGKFIDAHLFSILRSDYEHTDAPADPNF